MRLDEWQKYIDSQFLEEESDPVLPSMSGGVKTDVVPLSPAVSEQDAQAAQSEPAPSPISGAYLPVKPETSPNSIQNVLTMVVVPQTPPVLPDIAIPPRIEILSPAPETIQMPKSTADGINGINRTRRRSQSQKDEYSVQIDVSTLSATEHSEATTDLGLFEPLTDLHTDIPAFRSYLPSTHAAAGNDVMEEAQTESADASVPSPQMPEHPSKSDRQTNKMPQERIPRSRARHARNIRPEQTPSELSISELWAKVPRHVQTLLALERIEEEEVAQFSYKRPFQEKRHELIERLLDPILSLEDTARLLNVCPTTVRRYTNRGILTYYRKEPDRKTHTDGDVEPAASATGTEKETRQRRFRLSDILAFLENQQAAIESDRHSDRQTPRRRPIGGARMLSHDTEPSGNNLGTPDIQKDT